MTAAAPTVLDAQELTSALYEGDLVDEAGDAVAASTLTTATLTLVNEADGQVINEWAEKDCLNANGVTIDSAGHIEWAMAPADNPVVGDGVTKERHIAIIRATWGGTKGLMHRFYVDVTKVRV